MASKAFVTPLLLLLISAHLQARAQHSVPAPAPARDCTSALLRLSRCLTYVAAGSSLTRPEKGCCGALAGVVAGEAACLCQLLAAGAGAKVDTVRALTLPTICRVDAPPASICAGLGVPAASFPAPSGTVPAESGTRTPATTPTVTIVNGGPAMYESQRRLYFATVFYCTMLLTLIF